MIVKTQCKGRAFVGVEVGATNARQYFPKDLHVIELHLDHLLIQLDLAPDFWDEDHAQICDRRLSAWLESKNFNCRPGDEPIPLALIPMGKSCYRLKVIGCSARAKLKPVPKPEPTPAKDAVAA